MCDGWKKAFVWFSIISMNVLFAFSSLSFWIGCVPLEKRWKPFADGTCYDLKWVVSFGIFVSGKTISTMVYASLPELC